MKPGRIDTKALIVFLIVSIVVTLVLAFIDEGNYNFQWMKESGSWIAFLMYMLVFLASQIFVYKVVLDGWYEKRRLWFTPPIAVLMLLVLLAMLVLIGA